MTAVLGTVELITAMLVVGLAVFFVIRVLQFLSAVVDWISK